MSQKSEIKVYLPQTMIGELERKKKNGMRSKFIQQAIREKLDRRDKASLMDWDPRTLLSNACYRLDEDNKLPVFHLDILSLIIKGLEP